MSPVATGSVSENSLRVKRKGFVMTITLNRPEALNTLNLEAVRRIRRAIDEGAASDGVRPCSTSNNSSNDPAGL